MSTELIQVQQEQLTVEPQKFTVYPDFNYPASTLKQVVAENYTVLEQGYINYPDFHYPFDAVVKQIQLQFSYVPLVYTRTIQFNAP